MTARLQIGRLQIGRDGCVSIDEMTGGGDLPLRIGGSLSADDRFASRRIASAMASLGGSDEPVIPLYWEDGPEWYDGYYRVDRVSLAGAPWIHDRGQTPFTIDLEPVPGHAAPLFESTILGGRRTKTLANAALTAWEALPASLRGYESGVDLTMTYVNRSTSTGPVTVFSDPPTNTLFNARPQFFVPPKSWYVGAATLNIDGGPVVGREIPNRAVGWSIDNGIVKFTGVTGGIQMNSWSGSAWNLSRTIKPHRRLGVGSTEPGISFLDDPHTITVLRNAPEEVIIRLTYEADSQIAGSRFAVYIDISLRRGSRTASFYLWTRGYYPWGYHMIGWGTATQTVVDNGAAKSGVFVGRDVNMSLSTVADPTPNSPTTANTLRTQYIVNTPTVVAAFGYSPGSGTSFDGPASVASQWAAASRERIEAVVR